MNSLEQLQDASGFVPVILLRAARYASRYLWTEPKVTSHPHWGLND